MIDTRNKSIGKEVKTMTNRYNFCHYCGEKLRNPENIRFTAEGYPYGHNCCIEQEQERQGFFFLNPPETPANHR